MVCVGLTYYMLIWRFLSGDHTFQVQPQESERLFLRFPVEDVDVVVAVVDENVLWRPNSEFELEDPESAL
jgi:hypothetical protein